MELHNEAIYAAEEWCTKDCNPMPPLCKLNCTYFQAISIVSTPVYSANE